MKWATRQNSKTRVNKAGEALILGTETDGDLAVVNNWRSSHGRPLLSLRITLAERAKKLDPKALIAQRLKRLPSIRLKLKSNPGMDLSRMQDIGGCRAILKSVKQAHDLAAVYDARDAECNPERAGGHDYIAEPKADGYRGLHRVYKYMSRAKSLADYNGMRIEIQIRSALQHAWATAVETVSTYTTTAQKYDAIDSQWKRFFALVSCAIAIEEGCPPVPKTPATIGELRRELVDLNNGPLKAEATLSGFGTATEAIEKRSAIQGPAPEGPHGIFLLRLDVARRYLTVRGYPSSQRAKASEEYLAAETAGGPDAQVVLVSVGTIADLRKAYPNYFLNIAQFLSFLRRFLEIPQPTDA